MQRIVIPVTAIITLIALIGILGYTSSISTDIKEGNFEEAANKTEEYIVEEVEDEVNEILVAPFAPWIVAGVVAVAKIFGISLIFK